MLAGGCPRGVRTEGGGRCLGLSPAWFLLIVSLLTTQTMSSGLSESVNITATVLGGDAGDVTPRDVMETFWQWRLHEWPQSATISGIPGHNDRVNEYTEEAFQRRMRHATVLLAAMYDGDGRSLSDEDMINWEVLKDMLITFTAGFQFRFSTAYIPFRGARHVLVDWLNLIIMRTPLRTVDDYEDLLARYTALPTQLANITNLTRESIGKGYVRTAHDLDTTLNSIRGMMVYPQDTFFYEPFINILANSSRADIETVRSDLRKRAFRGIQDGILPAMWKLHHVLSKEYVKAAKSVPLGVYGMAAGGALYRAYLEYHLSLKMSPEEVHEIGVAEVEEILQKMNKFKDFHGFKGSLRDFMDSLVNQSTNYYMSETELMDDVEQLARRAHQVMDDVVRKPPTHRYQIKTTTAGPRGQYVDASLDGAVPGTFYVNVKRPRDILKFSLMALVVHELEPGHHLQSSMSWSDKVPMFRRVTSVDLLDVPFQWPTYTAYVEGWALYSEYLGEELGLYNDTYSLFGRYQAELWRACRLVIDTGIHAFGWSYEKAVEYLSNHTMLSLAEVRREVTRYIQLPGQACAYKIGELKIRELRALAERRLGSQFDKRDFHDRVLSLGPVPLYLLEKEVHMWVNQNMVSVPLEVASAAGKAGPSLSLLAFLVICAIFRSFKGMESLFFKFFN